MIMKLFLGTNIIISLNTKRVDMVEVCTYNQNVTLLRPEGILAVSRILLLYIRKAFELS